MALWDFLKRKKEVEKAKEKKEIKTPGKKVEKVSVVKETRKDSGSSALTEGKAAPSESYAEKRGKKKVGSFSYEVVREPHISEKSTNLGKQNKYVFKVYSHTNKPEIKKSVEGIYGVNVLSVNIIKIPKKKRRIGKTEGFRKGYSKAVVTVKEGQRIEVI